MIIVSSNPIKITKDTEIPFESQAVVDGYIDRIDKNLESDILEIICNNLNNKIDEIDSILKEREKQEIKYHSTLTVCSILCIIVSIILVLFEYLGWI